MPYFKNNDVNILQIHIPKTGGSSMEKYFSSKYKIVLNNKSLYDMCHENRQKQHNIILKSSMQHMTYRLILKYKKVFNIDFSNIKIITSVRNPYERIISDLFFLQKITINNSEKEVFDIIKLYLLSTNVDNHNLPQYYFITDDKNELIPNIYILHTETLTNDMHNLGYIDFNLHDNINSSNVNYYKYLNIDSINLINDFYHYDFILFNYIKKTSVEIV